MAGVGIALAAVLAAFVASALATAALIPRLKRWRFIDVPNARSSHAQPTPRGGGLAPVGVLALIGGALALASPLAVAIAPLLGAALVLAGVSLRDDRRSLSIGPRLMAQAGAVALGVVVALVAWPPMPWPWLPLWLAVPLLALGWMWFVNLFNFMDGIDGISGVALIGMGGGAAAVMLAGGGADSAFGAAIAVAGALLAAVAAGFLTQNWHPARVFLGDVGSIPLGYCAAALMLALAVQGAPVAALLLPAYHVFDATVTLGRRALRGEALTEAHRSHGYQRAVAGGLRHDQVCFRLVGLQLVLVGFAVASPVAPLIALVLGYGATAALWWRLDRRGIMITAPRG